MFDINIDILLNFIKNGNYTPAEYVFLTKHIKSLADKYQKKFNKELIINI